MTSHPKRPPRYQVGQQLLATMPHTTARFRQFCAIHRGELVTIAEVGSLAHSGHRYRVTCGERTTWLEDEDLELPLIAAMEGQ